MFLTPTPTSIFWEPLGGLKEETLFFKEAAEHSPNMSSPARVPAKLGSSLGILFKSLHPVCADLGGDSQEQGQILGNEEQTAGSLGHASTHQELPK